MALKLSRRALLTTGAVAIAVPPLAVLGTRGIGSHEDIIANYLKHKLPGLAVPDDQLTGFAAEFLKRRAPFDPSRVKLETFLTMLNAPDLQAILPQRAYGVYDKFARDLFTTFLFSTDFFTSAEMRPEVTQFVAYADPFALGCANPLSRHELT